MRHAQGRVPLNRLTVVPAFHYDSASQDRAEEALLRSHECRSLRSCISVTANSNSEIYQSFMHGLKEYTLSFASGRSMRRC